MASTDGEFPWTTRKIVLAREEETWRKRQKCNTPFIPTLPKLIYFTIQGAEV